MDTVIKNGLLITSKGRVKTSIGIKDGLIAGLYEPGEEPAADEDDRRDRALPFFQASSTCTRIIVRAASRASNTRTRSTRRRSNAPPAA